MTNSRRTSSGSVPDRCPAVEKHCSKTFVWNVSQCKKKWMIYDFKKFSDLRVKYPLFFSDFNETWIFTTVLENYSDIKFHENPSSGSRVVPCGQTDGQTGMTKLIVALRNFAKTPNNEENIKIGTKYSLMILLCDIWKYLGLFKIISNKNVHISSLLPIFVVFVQFVI
jgi:hypothetical protein